MEELKKIKVLMDGIDDAINFHQENCEDEQDREKFYEMGCELKYLLYHQAELILHDSMFVRDCFA